MHTRPPQTNGLVPIPELSDGLMPGAFDVLRVKHVVDRVLANETQVANDTEIEALLNNVAEVSTPFAWTYFVFVTTLVILVLDNLFGDRFKLVQQLCEQIQGDGSSEVDVCSRGVCGIGCVWLCVWLCACGCGCVAVCGVRFHVRLLCA